jgi:hypothetical protein
MPCTWSAPERVDGHARDDGGVDAARQADDHIGEPVLEHVVAGAQHQRVVQLGIGLGQRVMRAGSGRRGRRLLADQHQAHLLVGAAATRVEQALAVHRLDDEVGDEQLLHQQRGSGHQVAVGVEHHAAAVEHQLVLPAHLVDVGERAADASAARVASMRSRPCALPAWYGDPLMLMLSSAPPAACWASGPVGLHTSSQMLMPTFTPPISYSSYGSLGRRG